jgi:hypothetical protein
MEPERCAHAGCKCEATPGYDGFCSQVCAQSERASGRDRKARGAQGRAEEQRCDCGHPSCK